MSDSWRNNTRLTGLVSKHASVGILVDTNLLLIYGIGTVDRSLVSKEKGTNEYSPADFDLLSNFVDQFHRLLVTPTILAEVSNLAGRFHGHVRDVFRQWMRERLLKIAQEEFIPSKIAVEHFVFSQLGLTDATIGMLADRGILVLTSDLNLSIMLESRNLECILFWRELSAVKLSLG